MAGRGRGGGDGLLAGRLRRAVPGPIAKGGEARFVSGIADVAGGGERAVEIGMGEYAPSIRYYKNYNEMC